MQDGQAAAPQAGAPAADAAPQKGGGIAEALVGLDKGLSQVAKAVQSNPGVPDELKQQAQVVLDGYRGLVDGLMAAAQGGGGGGAPAPAAPPAKAPAPGGPVAPEAGASGGAVPMTHGMRR